MMGNALKMAKQQTLNALFQLGWGDREIYRETNIHRSTISRYRKQFQSVPEVPTDSSPAFDAVLPPTNSPAIAPHREFIRDELAVGLTAQRVYQDLVERFGFTGGYDCVKRYSRKIRKRNPRWFERLPTAPGLEAQVDFGTAPCRVLKDGRYTRPYVFKMTLSHSRFSYEELVWRQDTETWIRCHEHAFHSFHGVPKTIKLDNLKAGVIKPDLWDPELNRVYADYAKHAGFVPLPCQPYQPNQKGRVEHDVGYTKSNGLNGKRFESLEDGNIALRSWNKRWASTRIHGTTRVQVQKMFDETEHRALLPLPTSEFPIYKIETRKVDVTGCIAIRRNFYSVPYQYICKEVIVHVDSTRIRVLDMRSNNLLVEHRVLAGAGKASILQGCKPPYANFPKEHQEMHYCRRAKIVGDQCEKLVDHILSTDEYRGIYRVRGILKLSDGIDRNVFNEACGDAVKYNHLSYSQIKSLCAGIITSRTLEVQPELTQSGDCVRDLDEYQNHFNEKVKTA